MGKKHSHPGTLSNTGAGEPVFSRLAVASETTSGDSSKAAAAPRPDAGPGRTGCIAWLRGSQAQILPAIALGPARPGPARSSCASAGIFSCSWTMPANPRRFVAVAMTPNQAGQLVQTVGVMELLVENEQFVARLLRHNVFGPSLRKWIGGVHGMRSHHQGLRNRFA